MESSTENSNVRRMPRKDIALLILITIYAVVTFLPWSYSVSLAGVDMTAWLLFGLIFFASIGGLVAAVVEPDDTTDTN